MAGPVPLTGWLSEFDPCRELAVIVHGLGGDSERAYVLEAAHAAAADGLSSLRLNLRGADRRGPDFYHAGLTTDLQAVLMSPELALYERIFFLGFSLGGHMVLRFAIESEAPRFVSVAAICAPLDLDAAAVAIDRPDCWAYRRQVLASLVEIYAVVTDKGGQPVRGLDLTDFSVKQGRSPISIERFAIAEQVPLVLGLAVDTSESMWAIMPDTRKAAARFLGDVVTSIDQAFVVDFDNRPRLAHDTTGRVFDLISSLTRLQASGATALYDSILFSILQFDPGLGRKAIVLLSDGDDYNSHFSFKRVQRAAAHSGIPIYFIALGGFDSGRPSFRKDDLEVIAEDSGGHVFYVNDMEQVIEAYRQIGDELRSQYVLAYSTERLLTEEEISRITVEVAGKGLRVRAVVGRDR